MEFQRRILHHGSSPGGTPVVLSLDAVRRCWFELHRQGGCGSGELALADSFDLRNQIELGDWISFESSLGDRWYLGRVEERFSISPAEIRFRLEGMAIQLNEVYPGGFGQQADGVPPHRYANTDLFTFDPDRSIETHDSVQEATQIVALLLQQYVTPTTDVHYDPQRIETPLQTAEIQSLKFRGEESVRSIMKELSTRAQSASWGVDETGTFFFLRPNLQSIAQFREGVDVTSLRESRDREHLFNRLLLTGDYVYDRRDQPAMIARRSYRWRGNFIEPISQSQHGDRRIRIWVPWIRTQSDSLSFAREFFRSYSQPTSRFLLETTAQETLIRPWDGQITLLDQLGNQLTSSFAETIRVQFDHAPTMRMELGPLDPRTLWPEPPHDERWELPEQEPSAGGPVTLPSSLSSGNPGGGGGGNPGSSMATSGSSLPTSLLSSHDSSSGSSGNSSSVLSSSLVTSEISSNTPTSSPSSISSGAVPSSGVSSGIGPDQSSSHALISSSDGAISSNIVNSSDNSINTSNNAPTSSASDSSGSVTLPMSSSITIPSGGTSQSGSSAGESQASSGDTPSGGPS